VSVDEEPSRRIEQSVHAENSGVAFVQGSGSQNNHLTQNYYSAGTILPNDPESCYQYGEMKLQAGEHGEGEWALNTAAEAGHVNAMKRLAGLYAITDKGRAAHWNLKLAELGDPDAFWSLGFWVECRLDHTRSEPERAQLVNDAVVWYKKSCDAGKEKAAVELGDLLFRESRYEESIPYLEMAVEFLKRERSLDVPSVESKLKRARKALERERQKMARQEDRSSGEPSRRWWRPGT
jgi:TPR repeat protein